FQDEASASDGAVLTSMWHLPGMPADSGTPTAWLLELSSLFVQVHCVCSPELAARRFIDRKRHPGHLDASTTFGAVVDGLRAHLGGGVLDIEPRIDVDTSDTVRIDAVVFEIQEAFTRCVTPDSVDLGGADG